MLHPPGVTGVAGFAELKGVHTEKTEADTEMSILERSPFFTPFGCQVSKHVLIAHTHEFIYSKGSFSD